MESNVQMSDSETAINWKRGLEERQNAELERVKDKLQIAQDPNSSLETVMQQIVLGGTSDARFSDGLAVKFQKKVVNTFCEKRITEAIKAAKTVDECVEIFSLFRKQRSGNSMDHPRLREVAALRAISLANCRQSLDLYRLIHNGKAGQVALERAAKLAKSQDELWQVAVHARKCRNKIIWKQAVKQLVTKMK